MTLSEHDVRAVYDVVNDVYKGTDDLLFHGWHHIEFVYTKVGIFAKDLGADVYLAQISALLHDLNYVTKRQVWSTASEGSALRRDILTCCNFSPDVILDIESIIEEAAGENRHGEISQTAKALSDADTLFKALPTTPVLFASRFLQQTGYNIRKLANKVVDEQAPLFEKDIYFYSETARRLYLPWAETNLRLWKSVVEALEDPDVIKMLHQAGLSALLDK